jgi:CheY-like chemotaxis protein
VDAYGTVLLVDDDAAVRGLAAQMLAAEGHFVVQAAGPQEALEICARGERIDVLVTDVSMPGMSGRDLAARVRALRPGLPVLFISGYDDSLVQGGCAKGPFLAKPFSATALAAKVAELLRR